MNRTIEWSKGNLEVMKKEKKKKENYSKSGLNKWSE